MRIGPEGFPRFTLVDDIADWTGEYLQLPDGPDAGQPWVYTLEQLQFMAWWYAIDESGRFIYRRGVLRRMKGWGKDPVLATIAAVELEGPCRFAGWGADGRPIAKPHPAPWIQVAAVSQPQTRNTMTLFPGLFSKAAITEFGIDLGKAIIHTKRSGRIEAVTSSPAALEGGRPSLVIKNETQHWTSSNGGHEMSEVIDRNLAKSRDGSARAVAITNAHAPGQDSDAERDWDAWQVIEQGRSRSVGFLYDSLEAPADTKLEDEDSLRRGLLVARGDSTWLDIDRLVGEIYDPKTPVDMARRFYLNQIWAAQDSWLARVQWDGRVDATRVIADKELVCLGFDGSKSDDHTALIGCAVEDGHIFTLGVWDPEVHGGEAPRAEIDLAVRSAFDRYDVVGFYSDVHPWESYIDAWTEDLSEDLCAKAAAKSPIGFDMRSRTKDITLATEAFYDAVIEESLTHDGDSRLAQHVYNARRRPNAWGVAIGKEHRESQRKVDAAVSAILARKARTDYLALPDSRKRQEQKKRSGSATFL